MRTIIIEDNQENILHLRKLLQRDCPDIGIVAEATNAKKGMEAIRLHEPELVFLDIHLPDMTGFDMLSNLKERRFDIIFVTGHDQYGIQAIKMSALDYLLKPLNPKELTDAVDKARFKKIRSVTNEQLQNMMVTLSGKRGQLALPDSWGIRMINIDDIRYCNANNSYTIFHLNSSTEKLTTSNGIGSYEDLLRPYDFIRCHQSYLVNRIHIKNLVNNGKNAAELVLKDKTRIPVSTRRTEFVRMSLLNNQ